MILNKFKITSFFSVIMFISGLVIMFFLTSHYLYGVALVLASIAIDFLMLRCPNCNIRNSAFWCLTKENCHKCGQELK